MTDPQVALIASGAAAVAFFAGYLRATASMPKIIAKMSDDEIRALGRRSRAYRLIRSIKDVDAKQRVPKIDDLVEAEEQSDVVTARSAALDFVNRTGAGGSP